MKSSVVFGRQHSTQSQGLSSFQQKNQYQNSSNNNRNSFTSPFGSNSTTNINNTQHHTALSNGGGPLSSHGRLFDTALSAATGSSKFGRQPAQDNYVGNKPNNSVNARSTATTSPFGQMQNVSTPFGQNAPSNSTGQFRTQTQPASFGTSVQSKPMFGRNGIAGNQNRQFLNQGQNTSTPFSQGGLGSNSGSNNVQGASHLFGQKQNSSSLFGNNGMNSYPGPASMSNGSNPFGQKQNVVTAFAQNTMQHNGFQARSQAPLNMDQTTVMLGTAAAPAPSQFNTNTATNSAASRSSAFFQNGQSATQANQMQSVASIQHAHGKFQEPLSIVLSYQHSARDACLSAIVTILQRIHTSPREEAYRKLLKSSPEYSNIQHIFGAEDLLKAIGFVDNGCGELLMHANQENWQALEALLKTLSGFEISKQIDASIMLNSTHSHAAGSHSISASSGLSQFSQGALQMQNGTGTGLQSQPIEAINTQSTNLHPEAFEAFQAQTFRIGRIPEVVPPDEHL